MIYHHSSNFTEELSARYGLPFRDIKDLNAPELDVYTRLGEAQLRHYYAPEEGLFIAETPIVIERAMDAGYVPESFLLDYRLLETEMTDSERIRGLLERAAAISASAAAASAADPAAGSSADAAAKKPSDTPLEHGPITVYTGEWEVIKDLTGHALVRGALAAMRRKPLPTLEETVEHREDIRSVAVLRRITNPTNVGAIFRSAAALGVDAVLLDEECADPLQRRSIRVSMGTVFSLPWTRARDLSPRILHDLGFTTVGMALSDRALPLGSPELTGIRRPAIYLGSEGDGLDQETMEACDQLCIIPMREGVDSLNVAAASAVAFWGLLGQERKGNLE